MTRRPDWHGRLAALLMAAVGFVSTSGSASGAVSRSGGAIGMVAVPVPEATTASVAM